VTTLTKLKRLVKGTSLGLALCVALTMALSGSVFGSPGAISPANAPVHTAAGSSQQWAFGGNASAKYSCTNSGCFGGSTNATLTLSFNYYIGWVVIYTQTNVSSTQTMVEGQAALNASADISLSECVKTTSAPCSTVTVSAHLQGLETASGFTNLTSAGTVNLTPSGMFVGSNVPAYAVMNAASSESFNFSGNYNVNGIVVNGTAESGSATFVFGGNESSSINFPSPLGLVPLNPSPGDTWTAWAPYSASGGYHSGYNINANEAGHAVSEGTWLSGHVSPSGNLSVNGTDLGAFTLYDNYTNPVTQTTAQEISLDFGQGGFVASDGWVMVPAAVFSGVGGVLGVAHGSISPAVGAHPYAGLGGLTTGESAYYQKNVGIVGTSATGNTSSLSTGLGVSGPSLSLRAGPEPVSVAEKQYGAITSSQSSGSSGSSFPTLLVVVAVVVVLAGLLAALVVMRRRRRAPPAAYGGPQGYGSPQGGAPPGAYPGQMPPGPGGYPPAPGYPTPPPPTNPGTGPGQ
jgi:hypothetical protein